MDSYKVVIVEDDLFSRRLVRLIIHNHFSELEIVGEYSSVADAGKNIPLLAPHLVILDIQLEDGSAFDLLKGLQSTGIEFKIVFMSSYQSYLEEAVQFAAVDFLKKPFDEGDFVLALDRAIDSINDSDYNHRLDTLFKNLKDSSGEKSIIFKLESGPVSVPLSKIIFGKAIPGGAEFKLYSGEDFFVPLPLRRYEILLNNYGFFRCHPIFVINLKHIKTVDANHELVIFSSGHVVPFEGWRRTSLVNKYNALTSV